MSENQTELTEFLRSLPDVSFSSKPFYSPEGDFVVYYFTDEDHFAQRIDDVLTVYRPMDADESDDDGRVVGVKIKSVKQLLRELADYYYEIGNSGKVTLGLLILTRLNMDDIGEQRDVRFRYRELGRLVKGVQLEDVESIEHDCVPA